MTDNVIHLDIMTTQPVLVNNVLQSAIDADLNMVVVLGWDKEGDGYYASSVADGGKILWLLEKFKLGLLDGDFSHKK